VNFTKDGHYVAGMMHNDGSHGADDQWTVYLASDDAEKSAQAVSDASTFPDDAPLGWSVYFTVADADATIAAIEAAGGAVVIPAEDTPYGRLAAVTDPTGAMFKIVA
jgi:predicted enzyme related to lactoylglutathione lyase